MIMHKQAIFVSRNNIHMIIPYKLGCSVWSKYLCEVFSYLSSGNGTHWIRSMMSNNYLIGTTMPDRSSCIIGTFTNNDTQ